MPYSSFMSGGYKSMNCGYGYSKQSDGSCKAMSWYTTEGCYETIIINHGGSGSGYGDGYGGGYGGNSCNNNYGGTMTVTKTMTDTMTVTKTMTDVSTVPTTVTMTDTMTVTKVSTDVESITKIYTSTKLVPTTRVWVSTETIDNTKTIDHTLTATETSTQVNVYTKTMTDTETATKTQTQHETDSVTQTVTQLSTIIQPTTYFKTYVKTSVIDNTKTIEMTQTSTITDEMTIVSTATATRTETDFMTVTQVSTVTQPTTYVSTYVSTQVIDNTKTVENTIVQTMTEDRTYTKTYVSTATATQTETDTQSVTATQTQTQTATQTVTDTSLYSCLAGHVVHLHLERRDDHSGFASAPTDSPDLATMVSGLASAEATPRDERTFQLDGPAEASQDMDFEETSTEAVTRFLLVRHVPPTAPSGALLDAFSTLGDVKGILARFQATRGVIILAFHDTRHALRALRQIAGHTFPTLEEARLEAAFVSPAQVEKLTGKSEFISELDGSFFVTVEGRAVLSRDVQNMLSSFGELASFLCRGLRPTFHVDFCDCRDAAQAYKALNGRTILGARLTLISNKDALEHPVRLMEPGAVTSSPDAGMRRDVECETIPQPPISQYILMHIHAHLFGLDRTRQRSKGEGSSPGPRQASLERPVL
ncbi:hypothetical protein NUW54_g11029 [Trametes sanguinea]|uniref:Uncharacterized protein n=1 Tax=Trametes sanguinea TaxID=158606 RepID=A0ACC1NP22_9APHY|nr:hypothetical protein NUW54_g11029 [Trametes sanguinea]